MPSMKIVEYLLMDFLIDFCYAVLTVFFLITV